MKQIISRMVAALAIGSAMVAAVPAEARDGRRGHDRGYSRHWDGDRGYRHHRDYRGDRFYRGYGGPRGYYGGGRYYAPRYYGPRYYGYGYGHGYPRYRHYHDNDGALIAGIAGLAIGAAIASGNDY